MPNLIEKYLTLKNNYRNYDTRDALKRMQAFRRAVRELSSKGYPIGIELLGSISFGIVEPYSDADCVILHFCDLHKNDGECPDKCPNFIFEQNELIKALKRLLKDEMFNIEFLDCVNLRYIENAILRQDVQHECVYRLQYYRNMGRPVNRPLFVKYCNYLQTNEKFIQEFTDWSSEALMAYLQTSSHRHSFNKYNERIINKGLVLPSALKEELRTYLEDNDLVQL